MNIGIPRETHPDENRISLTAEGAYTLVKEGHTVFVEHGAGEGCGFSDDNFQQMGGQIVFSSDEAFLRSNLVLKVMPPTREETEIIPDGLTLFSFMQLRFQTKEILLRLMERDVTAFGIELIESSPGYRPFSVAMSEIAGNMLPQIAGRFMQSDQGGQGIAIGGFPGIPPSVVVILGAGNLGTQAAGYFLSLGAQVIVLDESLGHLRLLEEKLKGKLITSLTNSYSIDRALKIADVFIGAIFHPGGKTPVVIKESDVKKMKPRALIIDASIDQGGCVETSHPTTLSDPVFEKHGVLHYCVPNIPSAAARTASHALGNILLPFVAEIARNGVLEACREDPILRTGLYLFEGKCVHRGIAELFDLPYEEFTC
ncbi:MAG: alanine dehydrogenase [Deltaproteobacteria bacterium]|nr:alanine dehydrogenase [Deltaproteobacteria bacterium]